MKLNTPPRRAKRSFASAAPLLLLASASVASAAQTLSIGDMHSSYNRNIWWMSVAVIVMAILIFIGVSYALFYTVNKFREDKHTAEPDQFHGNNRLEQLLIGVPVIIVTIITILAARTMAIVNPTPPDALHVNVTGAQFWWAFEYPDTPVTGGTVNVTNGNELVIPAGRQVAVTVTAKDVIHAFWAPNLGGQRDAIPGSKKTFQIDTDQPGVYQGNCTVLCGASHANMRFKVVALPKAQYDAFIAGAQAYKAPTPANSSEQNGYNIFMQGKASAAAAPCASCHRIQGTPAAGAVGPDLSYFGSRNTLGAGIWEGKAREAHIQPWIKNCPSVKPGCLMPAYEKLSDTDLADLEAYLLSLKLPDSAAYWGKVPVR
ncbi:cytochrome c oxidase subunit II [Deinococcus sp. KNUC1210]|uniref:cytochrome c oxidase subunit II n=1 Tax=Deinococcus sp. KNUC1210 TaxID=2917691 RepID=UPI00351D2EB1